MKGFSSKTLSIRLKELKKGGILSRSSYNEIPLRAEYILTDKGRAHRISHIFIAINEKMGFNVIAFF